MRPAEQYRPLAFSGVHVIEPALLDLIPQRGVFSIIETYLSLAAEQHIQAYAHDADYWLDLGKPERLQQAEQLLQQQNH